MERIKPFIKKGMIKVLTGQRRVGKSYLLYQLIDFVRKQYPEATVIYINKEDIRFTEIRTGQDLHDYVTKHLVNEELTFLFVDEIQDIKDFHVALRSLLLLPDLDIYITGSNANLLSSDLAGYLSGRYIETSVFSLSYTEFLDFHDLKDTDDSLDNYLKYGGLPYLKHLPLQDEIVFEYLKNIYSTIIYRDVVNRFAVRNTTFLEQLVVFLANNIGSLFSAKKISDFLKAQKISITSAQIQLYVQHLVHAFIIWQVPRYDVQGKRVFEFGHKFYFENLGIRNAIGGYQPQDLGNVVENVVYNHLRYSGYEVKTGALDKTEIDFVAERNGETSYFQVALRLTEDKTIAREFGNLEQIKDNYPKTVITLEAFAGNTYKGIQHKQLRQFLTAPDIQTLA